MSDKIELMMLCGVLQSNFSCLSQSESRTQLCHVRISHVCDRFQPRSSRGYTDWVPDWSEASSGLMGLITDFLRQQWAIFVEVWD